MHWTKFPLIKFVILFALGLIIQRYGWFSNLNLIILFSAALLFTFLSYIFFKESKIILLITSSFLIIICGASFYNIRNNENLSYPFKEKYIDHILIKAEVAEINLPRENKLTLFIESEKYYKGTEIHELNEKIICNLYYENKAIAKIIDRLKPGNKVMIAGTLREPAGERNPGDFNYRDYLLEQGITAQLSSSNPDDFVIVDSHANPFGNLVYSARINIDKALHSLYNFQTAGLLRGLLLADRSLIDYSIRENFINAGVIHVLAVSGLHVGYIVMIYFLLLGRFNVILKYILTIIGLFFFVLITGAPPSVLRASIMASVILISLLANRTHNNFNALALAAFIILLINPKELFNPGFQLSFSAVLSIFIIMPAFQKFINSKTKNKYVRYILLFMAVSLAAQIGTIPFTVYYFEKLSIVSLFANLFVIPLIGVVVGIGLLTLFLYVISFWLASIFAIVNMLAVKLLFWVVRSLGSQDFSHFYLPNFSVYDALVFYFALLILLLFHKRFTNLKAKIILYVLLIASSALFFRMDNKQLMSDGKLSVLNIDLGNNESVLVKFPNGRTALINAGGRTVDFDQGERNIIPILKRNGISKVDYLFLTSLFPRNNLGIISLIENGFVSKIYKPKVYGKDLFDRYLESYLDDVNVDYKYYSKEKININGAIIYPIPSENQNEIAYYNIFNKSVPIKIVYGNTAFLFTGCLEERGERLVVQGFNNFLHSDVLKVANNGSNIGTSKGFLSYVRPQYAVIDVQTGNWFGYPSKEVVERLNLSGCKTITTENNGAVLFVSDGNSIDQINWKNY